MSCQKIAHECEVFGSSCNAFSGELQHKHTATTQQTHNKDIQQTHAAAEACTVKTMFTSMAHSIAGNKHSYGILMVTGHHFARQFAVRNPSSDQMQCPSLHVHGTCLVAFLFLGGRRWGDVAGASSRFLLLFYDFEEV
jgi:hypothetical protein